MADTSAFEMVGASGTKNENAVWSFQVPYWAGKIEDTFTIGAGDYNGLPETSRSVATNPDGSFTVTVTYEGNRGGDDEIRYGDRNNPSYQLQSSFEEEAIEAHPKINDLLKNYGGEIVNGRAVWPAKLPSQQNTNSGGLGGTKKSSSSDKNPMCGVEKYKKLSVQWLVAYSAATIPSDVLANVGRITSTPPGTPPSIDGRTKWLCMPPTANKRGNTAEITETYLLLEEEIAPELYDTSGGD